MATYNGHPSYEHWNAALWFGNDEGLYNLARESRNGRELAETCREFGYTKTADDVELTDELFSYAWDSVNEE